MEQGTIEKMFDYYFKRPQFKEEVFRALKEFFNRPDLAPGGNLELEDERDSEMFNEWFIFDFKLSNGKTPLEDFYETNLYNLKPVRLQVYKDLQDNHFGLYEVRDIRLGEGLSLENLQTGKIYEVREYSATFGLKKGQVFSTRVAKVGDHYELVSSNVAFGPVKLDVGLKKLFRQDKNKLNPKVLRDLLSKDREFPPPPSEPISLEEAEEDLKRVLVKYNLERFVNSKTIKEWIYNHPSSDPFPFELNILCGLLKPDMKNYNKALGEVLNVFNVFYNLCPQKELGASPFEKRKEAEQKGIPFDLKMFRREFPLLGWGRKYHKALQYMKKAEFEKALKKFNEVFAYLLKNKITYPEIFRLYANKGVCHLALGERELGEFMLKTSAGLNPFYDFAEQQLKKWQKKKRDFAQARKSKSKQDIAQDVGWQYYQFLEPLKINFAHILKEPSAIVDINPLQRIKAILKKQKSGN